MTVEHVDYKKTKTLFDNAILGIAGRYGLFYKDGKPCKAKIIETVSKTTCITCLDLELKNSITDRIDNMYKECHQQACSILAEELYDRFINMGLTVAISTEKVIEYCRTDILIQPSGHGINLVAAKKEIAVEVKTGHSLSLVQLYRYMLDKPDKDLILWRIRNKQVLAFDGGILVPLLIQFMKTFILRTKRLLTCPVTSCEHTFSHRNWSPNQQQLQEAFSDFAHYAIETLPCVVEVVVKMLDER